LLTAVVAVMVVLEVVSGVVEVALLLLALALRGVRLQLTLLLVAILEGNLVVLSPQAI